METDDETRERELYSEFHQILWRLWWVSNGTTQAWNPSRGGSERARPPGEEHPVHEEYEKRWNNARSYRSRCAVRDDAQTELNNWRCRPASGSKGVSEREILEQRILDEGRGWAPEDVARSVRCTISLVLRVRRAGDRDPQTGQPLPDAPIPTARADRIVRAREMRKRSLSLRQIALMLNVSVRTVEKDLAA